MGEGVSPSLSRNGSPIASYLLVFVLFSGEHGFSGGFNLLDSVLTSVHVSKDRNAEVSINEASNAVSEGFSSDLHVFELPISDPVRSVVGVRPKSSILDFPSIRSEFGAISSVFWLGSGGARAVMLPGLVGDLRVYAATSDTITGTAGNTDSDAVGNDISEAADLDPIISGGAVPTPTKGYMGLLCSDLGRSFLTEFSRSGELVFRPYRVVSVYAACGFGLTEPKLLIQIADADADCFAMALLDCS